jgi:hypothetical protein
MTTISVYYVIEHRVAPAWFTRSPAEIAEERMLREQGFDVPPQAFGEPVEVAKFFKRSDARAHIAMRASKSTSQFEVVERTESIREQHIAHQIGPIG